MRLLRGDTGTTQELRKTLQLSEQSHPANGPMPIYGRVPSGVGPLPGSAPETLRAKVSQLGPPSPCDRAKRALQDPSRNMVQLVPGTNWHLGLQVSLRTTCSMRCLDCCSTPGDFRCLLGYNYAIQTA